MGRRLFVGNLNFSTTSEDLKEHFAQAGTCESATVMIDRATGRSRGFGFVEMSTDEEAKKAVDDLNGQSFQGRNLNINEARERTPGGPSRGGYAGGGGGYAGGGGGYGGGGGGYGGGGGGYGGGGGGYGGGGGGYGGGGFGGGRPDFPPDFPQDFGGGGSGFGDSGGRGGSGGKTKPRKEGGSRRGLRAKKRSL